MHALEVEGDGADVGVVEGLLLRGGAAGDVVAFPEPGEVGALTRSSPTRAARSGASGSVPARARMRETQPRIWLSQSA